VAQERKLAIADGRDIEMRMVCVVACVAIFAASGSAWAEDCTKGTLWPFARSAGDCLTQTERAQGMTGLYGGALAATTVRASPIAAPLATPTQTSAATPAPNAALAACRKGWLWPFVREPDDCSTDQDRKTGLENRN
jgi:hypothetical protein